MFHALDCHDWRKILDLLKVNGADFNTKNAKGNRTLLHEIVSGLYAFRDDNNFDRSIDQIKYLFNNGADPKICDKMGQTPLHTFLEKHHVDHIPEGNERIINLLVQGININSIDKKGMTPLHIAATKGNKNAIKCLIELGADVDAKNEDGKTPLQLFEDSREKNFLLFANLERGASNQAYFETVRALLRNKMSTSKIEDAQPETKRIVNPQESKVKLSDFHPISLISQGLPLSKDSRNPGIEKNNSLSVNDEASSLKSIGY